MVISHVLFDAICAIEDYEKKRGTNLRHRLVLGPVLAAGRALPLLGAAIWFFICPYISEYHERRKEWTRSSCQTAPYDLYLSARVPEDRRSREGDNNVSLLPHFPVRAAAASRDFFQDDI